MKNATKQLMVVGVALVVLLMVLAGSGCMKKASQQPPQTTNTPETQPVVDDSNGQGGSGETEAKVPEGWVKDTTELLYGLGKVTYVVPEYFRTTPGSKWRVDRYFNVDQRSICHLSITGEYDLGGGFLNRK